MTLWPTGCSMKVVLLFSCPVVSDSLWPLDCCMPCLPVPHQTRSLPKFMFIASEIKQQWLCTSPSEILGDQMPCQWVVRFWKGYFFWSNRSSRYAVLQGLLFQLKSTGGVDLVQFLRSLGFGRWLMSTGFSFMSPTSLTSNKRINLSFEDLKAGNGLSSLVMKVLEGIFF